MKTLEDLAKCVGCTLVGDPKHKVSSVNDLKSARKEDVSFLANPRYRDLLSDTSAGVICIDPHTLPVSGTNFFVSEDPSRTFQQIAEILLGSGASMGFEGIHPTAIIHPSAAIAENVTIGPLTVIDKNAKIGPNTIIYPHVYIGANTTIGEDCVIYPGVMIRESCHIHNRVIIQSGAILGSCGFGYSYDTEKGKFIKLEQLGKVIIEDDVEIGANTTIDRARFKATIISKGTKIDNLVQIGHNAIIGEHNAIVSQSGVAGSAKTGKNVLLGGQSGIVGHVEIADNVKIATRGGVSKSIKKPGNYRGGPVMPFTQYNKQQVHLRKIETYVAHINDLEKRLKSLEEKTQ